MSDPYRVLGVSRTATAAEIRAAYRNLVKATHPDHNGGSPEAARRFEAVQAAYAEIQRLRKEGATTGGGAGRPAGETGTRTAARTAPPPPPPPSDPDLEARMANLERQVRKARERAQKAAREAMRASSGDDKRPTDEELGYVTTDDSFSKILADARSELSGRYAHAREHPVVQRVSNLIAGLEELAEKLDRPPRAK